MRDYLNTDPLYQAARKTNQSVHGWAFDPEPEAKRSPSSFLLVALAVGMVLICMAACLAAEVA